MNVVQEVLPYQLNRHETWNMLVPPPANKENKEFKIASLNIQTAWVTDNPSNLDKYPQYEWIKRLKPITQLILQDNPSILALSELHLVQAEDLKATFKDYQFVGYSSETQEPFEIVQQKVAGGEKINYGEFVGFLFDTDSVKLEALSCHNLEKGERHQRILVEGRFIHIASHVHFVVLGSHFDHLSLISREKSAEQELELIYQLEKQKMPWLSVGDRNWYSDKRGQEFAEKYISNPHICDFRDENEQGHYGPSGSFPGHLGLAKEFVPEIIEREGIQIVLAETPDISFRSRNFIKGINDYSYVGEFSPESHELLPQDQQGDLSQKNLISDHYYTGGTFRFV